MKVLYLTNLPSPYRVDFFSELGKLCDLAVVYERRTASDRNKKWTGKAEKTFTEIYLDAKEIGTDNSFSFKILKYLNKTYDYIIVGMYSTFTAMLAIQYMKFKQIPFMISSDGGFIKSESKINFSIKKYFISSANAWLSTGKLTTEYLIHYGAEKGAIYQYPFTSLYEKDILSKPVTIEEKQVIKTKLNMKEKRVVLSVGQFIPRKGYDILLKACSKMEKGIGIYIVGGQATAEYIDLAKRLNLNNVHFVDFMEKEKLKLYYRAADLFVLPTREDIWGLVINEAMAYGLPVITSRNCIAGTELVKDDCNGYLVKNCEDSNEYAKAIQKVLDRECINKMSETNLAIIKEYTIEKMAKRQYEILLMFKSKKDGKTT